MLIDIKIRWNSILPMVNRYLEIKTYLKAAFELFNDGELFTHEHDTDLKEIVLVLEPLNDAVTMLSKINSNIMEAEGAVGHIIWKLNEAKKVLSKRVLEAVLEKYNQRRNQRELSLLLAIHKGVYLVST